MTPELLTRIAIDPALSLLPPRMDSRAARVLMLAIAGQESAMRHRRQIRGPARGFWQFEQGGGVKGVMGHPASSRLALESISSRNLRPNSPTVWAALATDDVLAAIFARLLLFTDARPLPAIGQEAAALAYYIRNWRPGKPHPHTWPALYDSAVDTVRGGA